MIGTTKAPVRWFTRDVFAIGMLSLSAAGFAYEAALTLLGALATVPRRPASDRRAVDIALDRWPSAEND